MMTTYNVSWVFNFFQAAVVVHFLVLPAPSGPRTTHLIMTTAWTACIMSPWRLERYSLHSTTIYLVKYEKRLRDAPSQCETTLHCNVASHWLVAYTKWSLKILFVVWLVAIVLSVLIGFVLLICAFQVIVFTFTDFNLESQSSCNYDSVTVHDGDSINALPLGKFCGSVAPPPTTTSGNSATLRFKTDGSTTLRGFSIDYVASDGGNILTGKLILHALNYILGNSRFSFFCICRHWNGSGIWNSSQCPFCPLQLTHWGRDKMCAIFQTTFSNTFLQWKCIYFD